MKEKLKKRKIKTQEKEYFFAIKHLIVNEIEQGKLTVIEAKRKYNIAEKSTILNWLMEYGSL